jgi:flagellar biogenesis protein FliO
MFFFRALIKTVFFILIASHGLCAGNPIYLYSETTQPTIIEEPIASSSEESIALSSEEPRAFIPEETRAATMATASSPSPSLEIEAKPEPRVAKADETAASTPLWEGTIPKTEVNYLEESKPFESMLSIFSTLIIVIMLMFGVSWLLQKKGFLSKSNYGKVLSILPLDNKRLIYIVDIMGKVYILGVTEYNVNLIGELTDPAALKLLKLEHSEKASFDESLVRAEAGQAGASEAAAEQPSSTLVDGIKQAIRFQELKNLDR